MADREYNLHYKSDNADMLSKNQQVITSLQAVYTWLTNVKNVAGSMFAGLSRSAISAAKNNEAVAQSLNSVAASAGNAQNAVNALGTATVNARVSIRSATSALGNFITRMVAMRALHEIVTTIKTGFDEINKYADEAAEHITKIRMEARELASLMGKMGPDDRVIESVVRTSLATGATPEQVTEYMTKYKGVASVGEEKGNITSEVSQKLAIEGLRLARRLDIDESTAGEAAGSISLLGKVGSTQQGMEQLAEAAYGIQAGKMKYTEGFRALSKLAPQIVGQQGGTRTYGEAGVLLGAYSQISGSADQAQHMIIQTRRLLSETEGDKGEYLRSIGIRPEMTLDEKLNVLAPHVTGPDGEAMLTKIGFHAKREREVTVSAARNIQTVINSRYDTIHRDNDAQLATTANENYYNTDPTALSNRAKASMDITKIQVGQQFEQANIARKFALSRLWGDMGNFRSVRNMGQEKVMQMVTGGAGGDVTQTVDLDKEHGVVAQIEREAKRVKLDLSRFQGLHSASETVRGQAINDASQAIKARGGDPFGMKETAEKQLSVSERTAAATERMANTLQAIQSGRAMPNPVPVRKDAPNVEPARK